LDDIAMKSFTFSLVTPRVMFGANTLSRVGEELALCGWKRPFIVSAPGHENRLLLELLKDQTAGIFDQARVHVPVEVAVSARQEANRVGADCVVAFGGGSAIGLAKALALDPGLPILAIPTTYAGSEMTSIWGLTENGLKRTGRDDRVLPKSVIYDPTLLISLPSGITGPSGLNAMAHAMEAMYARNANPITILLAQEALKAMAASLRAAVERPDDLEARRASLYASWLCGVVLNASEMGIHHKLCHTLGGTFDLPHADVHAVILPYSAAYNISASPDMFSKMADAMGAARGKDVPKLFYDLLHSVSDRTSLASLGLKASDLDRAADLASQNQYPNPRPIERGAIRALLEDAQLGRQPTLS
jgi:maleylacetate reductase